MAAVPSIGRADRATPREVELTRALYERCAAQVYRYCLHQLGSREDAEDAVQSTFLNAFRGIRRGIVPERELAWLFKIAENVCLSRRRSSWRRERVESPADFRVAAEHATAPSRLADELLGLQDVLERMPDAQRRAILLREWQGLSYREVADELRLSQSAVETLIFRARRSLAKGLETPPETAGKRRLARGADLGNVVAALKSLLLGGGAAAAKVAAVVAVVGAGTVVASAPPPHHRRPSVPSRAPVVHRAAAVPVRHVVAPPPAPAQVNRPAPATPRRLAPPPPAVHVPPPRIAPDPAPAQPQSAPAVVEAPPTLTPPPAATPVVTPSPTLAPDATAAPTPAPAEAATTSAAPPAAPPTDAGPSPGNGQGKALGHDASGQNGNGSGDGNGHGGGDHDSGAGPHGHSH